MCYTQFASGCLALFMFGVAYYEWRAFHCQHYSIGLAFFGLMELLQVFQHSWMAVPEDGYAMCQNRVNIFLTQLGAIHIAFQPYFLNWVLQGLHRRHNLQDRIESDLIQKLQFLGALWVLGGGIVAFANKEDIAPATPECHDYNWMRQGYDPALDFTTPNLHGEACTYLSPSTNGHLAWVLPQYPSTYYSPSSSIHFVLMFFCHWILFRTRPFIAAMTCAGFLTGPILARYLTPSVNEQGAVWCFHVVFQMVLGVIAYRMWGVPDERAPARIVHVGKLGEPTLVYYNCAPSTETTSSSSSTSSSKNELECKLLDKDESIHSD